MSEFHIKTLTPVHIGSGEELIDNYDYLYFLEHKQVAILDERKLLDLLGGGREGLARMMTLIDQGNSLLSYLTQRYGDDFSPASIAKKIIDVEGLGPMPSENKQTPIREQIKSAQQNCLPGSSLKGALRTAMFAWYIDEENNMEVFGNKKLLKDRRGRFADAEYQKRFLGKDPNHDLFRLIQVGDTHFTEGICVLAKSINMHRNEFRFKEGIEQHIECIPAKAESTVRIKHHELLSNILQQRKVSDVRYKGGKKTTEKYFLFDKKKIQDIRLEKLFYFTNQQTKIMIEDELEFWEEQMQDGLRIPHEIDHYLEALKEIHTSLDPLVEKKEGDVCILRVGWGTGWLNMTGGWQEEKLEPYLHEELIRSLRPNIKNFPFPKTRRMVYDGTPLGYVKLNKT